MIKPKMGKINLKNGSVIYVSTGGQYRHVEGKSLVHTWLDEANPLDIINDMRFYLKRATQCIHKGYYDFALDNIKEALIVFKSLETNLVVIYLQKGKKK